MMPGCFGMLMAYDSGDDYCKQCQHNDECADTAYNRLHSLRNVVDVEKRIATENKSRIVKGLPIRESRMKQLKPRGNRMLTPEQSELVRSISVKKAAERAANLMRRGIDGEYIKSALQQRINPFANESPYFMYLTCEMLMQGGFEKVDLAREFVTNEKSQMSVKTAASHVSIALPIMKAFGVVNEINGRYELSIQGN